MLELNIPKITLEVPSAYFKPNKTKLKLVKTVKKEPRKASFPCDLGLMFGKPMKYALISRFNLFKIETEI